MGRAIRPAPWRACILVFVAALLFRLGCVVVTDQIHWFPRKEMVRIAMTFAETGELANPFAAPTGPTALAPPIYPIYLGMIFRIFGTGAAAEAVKCLLTSAVSALRCAMIPWLAIYLGLSLRTGLIGGVLSVFYIGALATDIKGDWAEAYAATAMVALFIAALHVAEDASLKPRAAAVLGFWWGLALLLSPALSSILGAFILVGALRFLRESPRRYISFVAILGIVAGLVISPWPIRNAIRLGSPIWAKDNFGIMLLNSNHPGADWDVFGNEKFIETTTPSWVPSVALKLKAVGEVAYDNAQKQEAMEWIRNNPGTFAHLVALRAFHFWFPPGRNIIHTALEILLTLVSAAGLYLLYVKHRPAALLILGIWVLYPPVYYIMLWSSRYRYPINWTFLLTAAVAISHVFSLMRARSADTVPLRVPQ
jgi:hypothetical protein